MTLVYVIIAVTFINMNLLTVIKYLSYKSKILFSNSFNTQLCLITRLIL